MRKKTLATVAFVISLIALAAALVNLALMIAKHMR